MRTARQTLQCIPTMDVEIEGIVFDSSDSLDFNVLEELAQGPELLVVGDDDCCDFDEDSITVPINIRGIVNKTPRGALRA